MDAGLATLGATSPSNIARFYSQHRLLNPSTSRSTYSVSNPSQSPCPESPRHSPSPRQTTARRHEYPHSTARETSTMHDKKSTTNPMPNGWVKRAPETNEFATLDGETLQSLRRAAIEEHRQTILESTSRTLANELSTHNNRTTLNNSTSNGYGSSSSNPRGPSGR